MRTALVLLGVLALAAAAACGDDGPRDAMGVIEAENAAAAKGDVQACVDLWAEDASLEFPDGSEFGVLDPAPYPTDDYDGDGSNTLLDAMQASIALTDAFEQEMEIDCTEVSDTVVECVEHPSDVFTRAAGVESPGFTLRTTVENGLIVHRQLVGPVGGDWSALDDFDAAAHEEIVSYEGWVADNHGDHHPTMFEPPCCRAHVATTPESVELHEELMPQYQDTL